MNPNNTTGSSRPMGKSLDLTTFESPVTRDAGIFSNVFSEFEGYKEKVQAAQVVQDNTRLISKIDDLIKAVNSRRTTTVKLDERVLVEQITDPIMEEAAWRSKRL